MRSGSLVSLFLCGLVLLMSAPSASALNLSTAAGGSNAQAVNSLYDGTGVRVGIIDTSNVLWNTHEAFGGRASSKSFGGSVSLNWHASAVAGIIGSEGWSGYDNMTGVAPDCTLYGAHVGGGTNGLLFRNVRDAVLDLSDGSGSFSDARIFVTVFQLEVGTGDGNAKLSLLYDYLARRDDLIFANAAGNDTDAGYGSGNWPENPAYDGPTSDPDEHRDRVTVMGDAYNGITVGGLQASGSLYDRVGTASNVGLTSDGRRKPELVAPAEGHTTAGWGSDTATRHVGSEYGQTSYATPHVGGAAAVMLDAAAANKTGTELTHATHHLAVKAIMVNAANKSVRTTEGADTSSEGYHEQRGFGRLDVAAAVDLLLTDEVSPGSDVADAGWALESLAAGQSHDYVLHVGDGGALTATLTWDRIVDWNDADRDAVIDYNELSDGGLVNLDLQLLDGTTVLAESSSAVDNLEHLFESLDAGTYTLRVINNGDSAETYALAYHAPEPATVCMLALGGAGLLLRRRRR
jgi:hypothetical protein